WVSSQIIRAIEQVVTVRQLSNCARLEDVLSAVQETPTQAVIWLDSGDGQSCVPWGPIFAACGFRATGVVLGQTVDSAGLLHNANYVGCTNLGKLHAKQRQLVELLAWITCGT